MLNDYGIEAIDLDNKVIEYGGYVWYGFPYVPIIRNCWNFECDETKLRDSEVYYAFEGFGKAWEFGHIGIPLSHEWKHWQQVYEFSSFVSIAGAAAGAILMRSCSRRQRH